MLPFLFNISSDKRNIIR